MPFLFACKKKNKNYVRGDKNGCASKREFILFFFKKRLSFLWMRKCSRIYWGFFFVCLSLSDLQKYEIFISLFHPFRKKMRSSKRNLTKIKRTDVHEMFLCHVSDEVSSMIVRGKSISGVLHEVWLFLLSVLTLFHTESSLAKILRCYEKGKNLYPLRLSFSARSAFEGTFSFCT